MSIPLFDAISLKPGGYDYKVKVRVIRKWKKTTQERKVFKTFNIILVDNMVKIHVNFFQTMTF